MIKFDDLFTNFAWKAYSVQSLKMKGYFPNHVRWTKSPNGNIAVLISNRSKSGADYPLNAKALRAVADATRQGRLKEAYVAFVEGNKVLNCVDADAMEKHLGSIEPITGGQFGPYWWIDEGMIGASLDDDPEPF